MVGIFLFIPTSNYRKLHFNHHSHKTFFKDNDPFIHTHILFTDTDFRAYGGHLFDCRIAAAGEFIIYTGDKRINRSYNDDVGLALWNCKI